MIVHAVYFWLKNDLSESDLQDFRGGLETLGDIESVDSIYIGTPAATDRPVIDRSYSFALTVVLSDMAAHDIYQEHATHKNFIANFSHLWEKVLIYDAD